MSTKPVFYSLIGSILILLVYYFNPLKDAGTAQSKQKELLIYCGITMIQPMTEIAARIEQLENVKISIIKGGSGDLLRSIKFNQLGDLFLPGSETYIAQAERDDLIADTVHVGYNKAALMVREGNPKSIPADLKALLNPDYYIVLGNPDTGSIGRETKKILTAAGVFNAVMGNTRELTTDSKRLVEVLIKGEADLVINWYATSTWPQNVDLIDALPIDNDYAVRKRLVLGLLKSSNYPDIARRFMQYTQSPEGREIFDRFGLYRVR